MCRLNLIVLILVLVLFLVEDGDLLLVPIVISEHDLSQLITPVIIQEIEVVRQQSRVDYNRQKTHQIRNRWRETN